MTDSTTVTAYKAFDMDLTCRGHQYEVGKTYEHDDLVIMCASGYHACLSPLDVTHYYSISNSRFCSVTLYDAVHGDDKSVAGKITIDTEIGLSGWIDAAVGSLKEKVFAVNNDDPGKNCRIVTNYDHQSVSSCVGCARLGSIFACVKIGSSGNRTRVASFGIDAKIGTSGNETQIASSGLNAQIASSGDYTRIVSSSNFAQIASSGDYDKTASSGRSAQIGSSGDSADIGSSGNRARIASAGKLARIGSSGKNARIASSGNGACITADGCNSVVAAIGNRSVASAADGCWIVLANYDINGDPVHVRSARVGGPDGLQAGVPYRLNAAGEFEIVDD